MVKIGMVSEKAKQFNAQWAQVWNYDSVTTYTPHVNLSVDNWRVYSPEMEIYENAHVSLVSGDRIEFSEYSGSERKSGNLWHSGTIDRATGNISFRIYDNQYNLETEKWDKVVIANEYRCKPLKVMF